MAEWAELRVHGVSGTPPEAMLAVPRGDARQVGGAGQRTRFYRPAHGPADHILEAFHWGDHTSGSARQGLWYLLLPFGLVNVAQFMLPPGEERPAPLLRTLCSGVLRVLALTLTVLFAVAVAVLLLDLVVVQWLASAEWWADEWSGPALAVGMLSSAAVVLIVADLGRVRRPPGERLRAVLGRGGPHEALENPFECAGRLEVAQPGGFSRSGFFAGDPDAPILRALHVAAGLLVIALVGWSAVRDGVGEFGDVALLGTAAALAGVAVVAAFLGDAPGGKSLRSAWAPVAGALAMTGLLTGVVSSTCAVVVALLGDGTAPAGRVPVVDRLVATVSLLGLSSLVLLTVLVLLLGRATPPSDEVPRVFHRFAWGSAPALIAGLSLFLGVGFTSAVTYAAEWGLSRLSGPRLVVSPLLQAVAFAWGVLVPVILALAVGLYARSRMRARQHVAAVRGTFVDRTGVGILSAAEVRKVARARTAARLKNDLPVFLITIAAVGGLLGTAMLVAQVGAWEGLSRLASAERGPGTWATLLGAGTLVGLALLLFLLGWLSSSATGLRRGVNVVWDVIAFWPRAIHPFVPEPYSQDVVPHLRQRIADLQDEIGGRGEVVVAAHSQGSLVALAALLSVPEERVSRIGVLTFGSQLRLLFPRAFPAYVTYGTVRWVDRTWASRWVSLFRDTDHIGGPVASWCRTEPPEIETSHRLGACEGRHRDRIDRATLRRVCGNEWRLADPPVDARGDQPVVRWPMRRHSDYWTDADWGRAVHTARTGSEPFDRDPVES